MLSKFSAAIVHLFSLHRPTSRVDRGSAPRLNCTYAENLEPIARNDFAAEMALTQEWHPIAALGAAASHTYSNKRALLESTTGGSYYFTTEGTIQRFAPPGGIPQIQDNRTFEGWRHNP